MSVHDLKKRIFTVTPSSPSDSKWQLEDTSPGANLCRCTAQSPNYSAVRLNVNRVLYTDRATEALSQVGSVV